MADDNSSPCLCAMENADNLELNLNSRQECYSTCKELWYNYTTRYTHETSPLNANFEDMMHTRVKLTRSEGLTRRWQKL